MQESSNYKDSGELTVTGEQMVPEQDPSQLPAGMTFAGRYRIVNLVGRGGMGSVYRALDLTLNRDVALKLLHKELIPDEHSRLRFQQEARAASRIKHPGVIPVFDFGVTDEQCPYLIMDFVEGQSLADLMAWSETLSTEEIISIFIKVADTLAHAHSQGVIHRDLKPRNILVVKGEDTDEADVRVVDFGIAKILDNDEDAIQKLTMQGHIFGSPLYMSPEQCVGAGVDARSDIYSLGCVMYEAFTGNPPFWGDTAYDTMLSRLNNAPPPVDTDLKNKSAGREIGRIVTKALAKDPADRYQSMIALRDDLSKVLSAGRRLSARSAILIYLRAAAAIAFVLFCLGAGALAIKTTASIYKESASLPIHIWQTTIEPGQEPLPPNFSEIETWARACLGAAKTDDAGFQRIYQLTTPLANLHRRYGFYEEAAKEYNDILKIVEKHPNDFTVPERLAPERLIADCYFYARLYDKALYWYQEAVKTSLHLLDEKAAYFIQIDANMADIFYSQGKMGLAFDYFEKAVALSKKNRTETNEQMAPRMRGRVAPTSYVVLLMSTGDALFCMSSYAQAKDYYELALIEWRQWKTREGLNSEVALPAAAVQNLTSRGIGACEYNLALTDARLGNLTEARLYFESSLRDLKKCLAVDDPILSQAINGYGQFLRKHYAIRGFFEAMNLEQQTKRGYH